MAYQDYIVMIDENGQPYIAHGKVGDFARNTYGAARKTAHKYLDKALIGGKWVYAYTQKELEALRRGGKRLKAAAKDKLGFDERERYQAAKKRYQDAYKEDYEGGGDTNAMRQLMEMREQEYSKTALGRIENLKNALSKSGRVARQTIGRYKNATLGAIRSGAARAGATVRNAAGELRRDATAAATKVGDAASSAVSSAAKYVPGTQQNQYKKALDAYSDAMKQYQTAKASGTASAQKLAAMRKEVERLRAEANAARG